MKTNDEIVIFCKNMVYLRKKHKLSQRDMAKKLHIGVATLRKLEQGDIPKRLRTEILWYIYKNFNIPINNQFEDLSSGYKK